MLNVNKLILPPPGTPAIHPTASLRAGSRGLQTAPCDPRLMQGLNQRWKKPKAKHGHLERARVLMATLHLWRLVRPYHNGLIDHRRHCGCCGCWTVERRRQTSDDWRCEKSQLDASNNRPGLSPMTSGRQKTYDQGTVRLPFFSAYVWPVQPENSCKTALDFINATLIFRRAHGCDL